MNEIPTYFARVVERSPRRGAACGSACSAAPTVSIDFQSDPDEDWAYHVPITRTDRFDLRDGRLIDPLA